MGNSERRYEPEELHKLFTRIFDSEDGEAFKHILEMKFRRPPLMPTQAMDGQSMSNLTYVRLGEENVLRWIESVLNYNTSAHNIAEEENSNEDY